MMDMEMNAELERDGGSDIGEASPEGSSAGSIYCTLEQDFARITSEMKGNEILAAYEGEYTRLFEALYKSQQLEQELSRKCEALQEELSSGVGKITELESKCSQDSSKLELLKQEVVEGKRLADAAHAREQRCQQVIENLRLSVAKLSEELEMKNKQLALEDAGPQISKEKDGCAKDRERLLGEVDALKQRLKTVTNYKLEAEAKLSDTEDRLNELQEKFDKLTNDMGKERREREKLDSELQASLQELGLRLADLQTAEETLKTMTSNAAKQDSLLKEQVLENEKKQKEIKKLMARQTAMKLEVDRITQRNEKLLKETTEKNDNIKDMSKEIQRLKEEASKMRSEKDNAFKRLTKEVGLKSKAEDKLKHMGADLRSCELNILTLQKQLDAEKKNVEKLNREKESATKNNVVLEDLNKKLGLEISVLEQSNRKMESSLDDMTIEMNDLKRQVKNVEKERDRCVVEGQELVQQVEDCMDQVKLKRLEITDYQKQLLEGETKLRQHQQLFEEVRMERNNYKKGMAAAQTELAELKTKMKNLNQQMSLMKDQLAAKDAELLQHEFLFNKMEKEKDALRSEMATVRQNASKLRKEMETMREEEKRQRHEFQEATATLARQRKDIDSALNERDVIGAQLVRRNDELAFLRSKYQVLNDTLARGEKQYEQRLREIKMLKLEIRNLKLERAGLVKSAHSLTEIRGQLFGLERQLAQERLKVAALEEELENPLNVHRWRNLEGTDPDTFELVRKIQLLQKRILKMSAEMIEKEKRIKDTEKLYMSLREIMSKQPGPDVVICLNKTRRALRDRGKKMKCLIAELNMMLTSGQKFELEKMKKELSAMRAKCYAQKKSKKLRAIEPSKENRPMTEEDSPLGFINCDPETNEIVKTPTTPLTALNK